VQNYLIIPCYFTLFQKNWQIVLIFQAIFVIALVSIKYYNQIVILHE